MANESVGENFTVDLLWAARDKTLKVIETAAALVTPGMTESQAKTLIQKIQTELGGEKAWHPPQIRFGKNTLLAFGEKPSETVILKEDDIFFFDLGPLFDVHEGDVGRPFTVGDDAEMKKCCEDAENIWNEVRNHWKNSGVSGVELYEFAERAAKNRGWLLGLKGAAGHRVADFPHVARRRGTIKKLNETPGENRWILEIQIRHPARDFGAFFEDLLT